MSSTVTNYSNNINVSYPVPGVDNDTQGFRDNFSSIKTALSAAASELNYLQLNTVKLNTGTNDYNYSSSIQRVILKSSGFAAINEGEALTEDADVNFQAAHYHKFAIDNNITLNLINLPPTTIYGSIFLELRNNSTTSSRTVTLDGDWTTLKGESSFSSLPQVILTTSTTTSHVLEFWTTDGGSIVFVKSKGSFNNV
jgi:hypothetical protein